MARSLCRALLMVEEGQRAIVVAVPELWANLERVRRSADEKERRGKGLSRHEKGVSRVLAYVATACSTGFEGAQRTSRLVTEGRHSSGLASISDVAVFAFKHDQYRCYGGYLQFGTRRCFTLVEADDAKKQNKADSAILARVARRLGELMQDAVKHPLETGEVWPAPAGGEDEQV